jgi:hypothetical protein
MTRYLSPLMLTASTLLLACGGGSSNVTPLVCDDVDRTQQAPALGGEKGAVTLSGTYRVDGRIVYDENQVVTVEPGTVFLMGADSSILVGWRGDPARLIARGTAEYPILFCGTQKKAGHWQHVQLLTGTRTDSALAHVRFEDGGKDDAAFLSTVDVQLESVAVHGSATVGMRLEGLAAGSERLVVKGSGAHALELDGQSAVSNLPAGDYTGNAVDVALLSGISDTNVVLRDRGIPYRQTETRVVFGEAGGPLTSLTLEAGVTYQFCQDCYLYIGWRDDPGAIYARGTAAKPVVFTSARAGSQPGDWDGLTLLGGTRSDSVIEHAEFRFGGKVGGANLIIDGGQAVVRQSKFLNSAGHGIRIESAGPALTLSDNTFEGNASGDIHQP